MKILGVKLGDKYTNLFLKLAVLHFIEFAIEIGIPDSIWIISKTT